MGNPIAVLALVALVLAGAGDRLDAQPHSGAGAIAGRVVDAVTATGLARVLVQVEGAAQSATTLDDGTFQIQNVAAGERRLVVAAVGYAVARRVVDVAPDRILELTIPLIEGTGTHTESVTVTADWFRRAEPAVAAQQALGSLDLQNLRGVLADDPLRAVQVLPGIAAGDDLRSEFSVRGSGFNRINFTVDGFASPFLLHTVRAVEEYSASGSVAMINSDILEDVTLLSGAYPQRFGNRTGAQVEFRLRDGSRERRQLRASVSGTNATAVLEGPVGESRRGSWLVSARQSYLQLIAERLIDEGLHFGFSDAQAKLVYDVTARQRAELTLLAGRSKLERSEETWWPDQLVIGRNASVVAIGSWRFTAPKAMVTARTLVSQNDFANDTEGRARIDWGHDASVGGRLDAALILSPAVEVESGLQLESTRQTRTRQRFSGPGAVRRTINEVDGRGTRQGAYSQVRWTAGGLTVVPGLRADRWSLTGESTVSPWLQAEWRTAGPVTIRGGTGVYRQFPEYEQVIGVLGRPDARSERAVHRDVGLEYRAGAGTRWQVTFYDRMEQGVYHRPDGETRLVNGRVALGSVTAPYEARLDGDARGVELLVHRKMPNGLTGWFAYSYGHNRYRDRVTGASFWGDLDQRHTLNAYLFYRLSDRTSASGKLRAGSNTPAPGYYGERDGAYVLSAERNALRLPTYARLDLRANRTYTWAGRRITLFGEVLNVLNRANVRFSPPSVNRTTGQVTRIFEPLIPVIPSAGMLIEW